MFKPHNPQTANLPFSAEPINWLEPVECNFGQLRDVVAAAERAGFQPVRMACITGGYKVTFQREASSDAIAAMLEVTRRTFQPGNKPATSSQQAAARAGHDQTNNLTNEHEQA